MMDTRHIQIKDYQYDLPDERIAKFPVAKRDTSKLLVYRHGDICHDTFCRLPDYLPAGALMVFNNTRVIQARIHFHKATGAKIEVFLLEPAAPADDDKAADSSEDFWAKDESQLKLDPPPADMKPDEPDYDAFQGVKFSE